MADTVVVTETRVDVVTVTGSGTTDTIQVTGDKQIEVLTVGVQGPQGPGSVLTPATTTTLGGIIVGNNLSITANGVLSATIGGLSQIVNLFNGRSGTVVLQGSDVETALGYSPPRNLSQLSDVQLSSPTQGDLLSYNQSISKWANIKQSVVTDGGNF